MASKLAAAKIAAWSGVRAVIAAADAPGVVRRRDRRARRSAPSVQPRARAAPEPQALDRVRPRRRRAGSSSTTAPAGRSCADKAGRCSPPGVREVEGAFEADDAVEIVGADGRAVRQGPRPLLGGVAARRRRAPDHRPRPTARRTRSSTATTSSCCPDCGRRLRCRSPPLACVAPRASRHAVGLRHTLASRARRRPAGGESSSRASTVGEEREEGEAGSPPAAAPLGQRGGCAAAARPHPSRTSRRRGVPRRTAERSTGYTRPHVRAAARVRAGAPGEGRGPAPRHGVDRRARTPPCSPPPTCSSSARAEILAANARSTSTPPRPAGMEAGPLDRLRLTDARIAGMADGPARRSPRCPTRSARCSTAGGARTGSQIERVRVPLGVVAIIYENRPNVTSDAAGHLPEVGQRGAPAGLGDRAAVEPRDRRRPARGAHQGRAARRRACCSSTTSATRPRSSSCSSPTSSTA